VGSDRGRQVLQVRLRLPFQDDRLHALRVLFLGLGLAFIDDNDFDQSPTRSVEVAVRLIADKRVVDIQRSDDWTSHLVSCLLDFVDKALEKGDNLVSVAAVCYVVNRMTKSVYLLFDNNLAVLVEFCLRVLPRVNDLVPGSKHVEESLSGLGEGG
jgi:hypothetical protein